jgi:hypothetical protein
VTVEIAISARFVKENGGQIHQRTAYKLVPAHGRFGEVGAESAAAAEVVHDAIGQVCAPEDGTGQIASGETSATQVGTCEIGSDGNNLQSSARKICASEVRPRYVDLLKVGAE